MKVVAGATAAGVGSTATGKISPGDFTGAMYLAGAASSMEVLSVHSYADPDDPTLNTAMTSVNEVRAARDWFGDGLRAIWVTETGASSSGPGAMSEDAQATVVSQLDRRLRSAPGVEMVLFHTLVEPNRPPESVDPGFGLVTRELRRKPGFCALGEAWGSTEAC